VSDAPTAPTRPPRRFKLRSALILAVLAVAASLLFDEIFLQRTNCGGNSAALSACSYFSECVADAARNRPGQFLAGLDLTEAAHRVSHYGFIGHDEFLIAPYSTQIDPSRRDVVIVCKKAYGNVPKPSLWNLYQRHLGHAVGYSNGEVDLVSPSKYAELDLRGFVPGEEWAEGR
jgi:hypothetical protein